MVRGVSKWSVLSILYCFWLESAMPMGLPSRKREGKRESEIGKVKLCNMDIHDGCGLSS